MVFVLLSGKGDRLCSLKGRVLVRSFTHSLARLAQGRKYVGENIIVPRLDWLDSFVRGLSRGN